MTALYDRIWITSKTRMISERRYLSYDLAAHLMINTLSAVMLLASIYPQEIGSIIPGFSKINVACSILLFAISLIVYGFKFGEKAARHRECYLKLQDLIEHEMPHHQMAEKYSAIMECYPNHASRDYFDLIFERCNVQNNPICSPGTENKIIPSKSIVCIYFLRRAAFLGFCYALPIGTLAISILSLVG
ncbi:SLATT domain-containing protein [Azospirillum sp. INR13]|uniref:SLATT domain-containing protein n=1 Tax=Azospirillum sp. INR13 TaxID=2596919 RepID=UPI0018927A98|nr:SLATT domain-containing protein [Azospirillum sp. INR13]MBF5095556.1 SLATT domain-containing protein [Azospirillum sp. INR13]